MRMCRRRLPRATAALLCASVALLPGTAYADTGTGGAAGTDAGHPTPAPPAPVSAAVTSSRSAVTTSHYMVLVGTGQDPDQIGYNTGCSDGKAGTPGLRVLFFGTQEAGDKLRPPGTSITTTVARVDHAAVKRASLGWIRGFTQCGTATAVVAVATNNKADGGVSGPDAGTSWARLVQQIGTATPSGRVTVSGGLDAEPKWSAPDWARGWVDAYVRSSGRPLYVAGSADGCLVGHADQCANKWTTQDIYHVATGAGTGVYATPQIYRTDGIQARQWAGVSQLAQKAGNPPLRFASVMTQQKACTQRPPCAGIDNSADSARDQLTRALADPGNLDGSKNIRSVPTAGDPRGSKDSGDSQHSGDSEHSGDAPSSEVAAHSPTPGAPTTTDPATTASKKAAPGAFGSTDVAWPDDPGQLAWLTRLPMAAGEPAG